MKSEDLAKIQATIDKTVKELEERFGKEKAEALRKVLEGTIETAIKAEPLMLRAKEDYSNAELEDNLDNLLAHAAKHDVKPKKTHVVMPTLHVYSTKKEDGKRHVTLMAFADGFNEDRKKLLFGAGAKFGQDMIDEVACAYLITEAWQASYLREGEPKEGEPGFKYPSERDDKQEVLMIAGMTTDGRATAVSVPIRRTKSQQRKVKISDATFLRYSPEDKSSGVKPEILEAFMSGYLAGKTNTGRTKN